MVQLNWEITWRLCGWSLTKPMLNATFARPVTRWQRRKYSTHSADMQVLFFFFSFSSPSLLYFSSPILPFCKLIFAKVSPSTCVLGILLDCPSICEWSMGIVATMSRATTSRSFVSLTHSLLFDRSQKERERERERERKPKVTCNHTNVDVQQGWQSRRVESVSFGLSCTRAQIASSVKGTIELFHQYFLL